MPKQNGPQKLRLQHEKICAAILSPFTWQCSQPSLLSVKGESF